jgi:hypothetical protein
MIARAKAKKATLTELEFGRNVSHWQSVSITRDDLIQYLGNNAFLSTFDVEKDDDAELEDYLDRVWASLCGEANSYGLVEMEDNTDGDHESLDEDDEEFVDVLNSHADDIARVVLREREAKKAEAVAEVVVPVVPEKTRDELVAEIARLNAELEAIKEKMRNAMASLGY